MDPRTEAAMEKSGSMAGRDTAPQVKKGKKGGNDKCEREDNESESYANVANKYKWEDVDNKRRERGNSGNNTPWLKAIRSSTNKDILVRDYSITLTVTKQKTSRRWLNLTPGIRIIAIVNAKAFQQPFDCSTGPIADLLCERPICRK